MYIKYSSDEMTKEITCLKRYFDYVRVVNPFLCMYYNALPQVREFNRCYEVWNKERRCSECISAEAVMLQRTFSKLEKLGDAYYSVVSVPVMVGEDKLALEIVKKIDFIAFDNPDVATLNAAEINSLFKKAYADELTGVYNRRYFSEKFMNNAAALEKGFMLCLADVDNLKLVNDTYGHIAGDELIKLTTAVFVQELPLGENDFIARVGGDEIAIYFENVKKADFITKLKCVCEKISNGFIEEYPEIRPNASFGAIFAEDCKGSTAREVFDEADKKMYKAKSIGKGQIVV